MLRGGKLFIDCWERLQIVSVNKEDKKEGEIMYYM